MKKKLFIFLVCIGFLPGFIHVQAQPLTDYNTYREKYPLADVISTNYECTLEIKMVDNKPKVFYRTVEEFFYLGENNTGYSKRSIHYSGFYKLIGQQAIHYAAGEKKYRKTEITDFKVSDFANDNIFHDDSKEMKFMFPSINKGDKTYIMVYYELTDLHMLPKLSLSPYLDYENIRFTLLADESIEIGIDTFFIGNHGLNYSVSKKGTVSTHTWTGSSKKWLEFESDGPDRDYLAPQYHIRIKSYSENGKKVNVLSNLDDLYKWNCGFINETREDFSAFRVLSDSIVGKETDTLKKAALIYGWVQANIRYIALEAGYAGLIPAKASEVCKERYGDCKGMANVLYNLMRAQGLEAYLVWIGTRDLPYKYTELPTPSVDNHMIAVLKHKGEFIFLDATANNLRFGLPSPFIQGKEGLIGLNDCSNYLVKTVPVVSADENMMYDSCFVQLKGKNLVGSGVAIFTGYQRMVFFDRLNERNYKYIFDRCRSYLLKGSNRFILDTFRIENMDNKNLPFIIYYSFNIPDYAVQADKELYLNLNLDKISMLSKIDLKRNVAVEYRFKSKEVNVVYFDPGKGNKVSYLPESKTWKQKDFFFENTYQLKGNILYRNETLVREPMFLMPDQFPVFNQLVETMQKNYSEQIILNQP